MNVESVLLNFNGYHTVKDKRSILFKFINVFPTKGRYRHTWEFLEYVISNFRLEYGYHVRMHKKIHFEILVFVYFPTEVLPKEASCEFFY